MQVGSDMFSVRSFLLVALTAFVVFLSGCASTHLETATSGANPASGLSGKGTTQLSSGGSSTTVPLTTPPPPEPTTTGVPRIDPPLEGSLPPGVSSLGWVVETVTRDDDDTSRVSVDFWQLDAEAPFPPQPVAHLTSVGFCGAAIDSSGDFAATSCSSGVDFPTSFVMHRGEVVAIDEIVFGQFAWHPSQPVVAYVVVDIDEEKFFLVRAEVTADTRIELNRQVVAEIPEFANLIGWGDWGYLIEAWHVERTQDGEIGRQLATYLLDLDGSVVKGAPVQTFDVSASSGLILTKPGITGSYSFEPGQSARLWSDDVDLVHFDQPGLTPMDVQFSPVEVGPLSRAVLDDYVDRFDTSFALSKEGRVVIYHYLDTPETQEMPVQIIDLPSDNVHQVVVTAPFGWASDLVGQDRYLVYSDAGGSIRFLDWQSGDEYAIHGVTAPIAAEDLNSPDLPNPWESVIAIHAQDTVQ